LHGLLEATPHQLHTSYPGSAAGQFSIQHGFRLSVSLVAQSLLADLRQRSNNWRSMLPINQAPPLPSSRRHLQISYQ